LGVIRLPLRVGWADAQIKTSGKGEDGKSGEHPVEPPEAPRESAATLDAEAKFIDDVHRVWKLVIVKNGIFGKIGL
jgi:hypothetical protein